MMLRLKTLGGLALLQPDGSPAVPATQRRRLALLALTSSARDAGFARDKAMALLWSEVDADRASHSLGQLVYALRRESTDAELLSPTGDLRLNPLVDVDRWRFDDAMRRGAIEEAVDTYRGAFLDGFHLPDAPEFERWVDGERADLAGRYQLALEQLAATATDRGDHSAAVAWWTRASSLDPLSARVAAGMLRSLADAGELAAAQRFALGYEATLKGETGASLDPIVLRAIGELAKRASRAEGRALGPATTETGTATATAKATTTAATTATTTAPTTETTTATTNTGNTGRTEKTGNSEDSENSGNTEIRGNSQNWENGENAGERARGAEGGNSEESTRALRGGRPMWLRVVLVASVLLAVLATLVARRVREPQLNDVASGASSAAVSRGIAVLPFRGSTDSSGRYLRDAIPVLLGAALDGAGSMRSVDGNAVARAAAHTTDALPGPTEAASIARAVGASTFVLGEVASASGRVQLAATVYDAMTSRSLARGTAAGPVDSLFAVVDRLAAELAANLADARGTSLVQVARRTTSSLPAFKRFLDGEVAFREARIVAAQEAFREAIELDSTFALAAFRLANAYEWNSDGRNAMQALDIGSRHADRLPPRERELMSLNRNRLGARGGQWVDLEGMARAATERRPDDAPFLLELGEVLFHGNPPQGRSLMESREPLRRAAQLDPDVAWEPLFHLLQLAALRSNADELDSLAKRLPPSTAPYLLLTTRGLQAATRGNRRLLDSVIIALRDRPAREAFFASEFALAVSLIRGDTAMARAAVEPLTRAEVPVAMRGAAWMRLAMLEGALGHWNRVVPALDRATELGAADVSFVRARLLTLPMATVPGAERDSARAVLLTRAGPGSTGAAWIRAADLARVGKNADALALTDTLTRSPVWLEEQRFLRAELLWSAGRRDEAMRWYTAASEGPFGLVFFDVLRARRGAR